MKKIITMAIAVLLSVSAFAQKEGDRIMRISTIDGDKTPFILNDVKEITFEEIIPLTMDIEVSNIQSTQMDIDFPMPEGCKNWLFAMRTEPFTGTDLEMRQEMKEKFNDNFNKSKFLRIPELKPGTKYYIYALMYDHDGVVAGFAQTSATTLSE